MGERTAIAWTEATWNPWYGCTKVSPGCAHCYMFREQVRYGRNPEVVTRSKTKFAEPLKWKEPRRIFTCSWSDWFHEAADAWRDEAWEVIRQTPQHTYQILTKRPERIIDHLPADWGRGWTHVWLGSSVESQRLDYRAAIICTVPAAVRFISAEPLLGRLDLERVNPYERAHAREQAERNDYYLGLNVLECPRHAPLTYTSATRMGRIDWVIAGGESGPDCRPMHADWVRALRDQCQRNDVAFFLKQLGGHPDARAHVRAMLDGRTWTEMPDARQAGAR